MPDERGGQSNAQLQVIEELIYEHVQVDCDIVQIDDETWALHGTIAVDGEVIVAEFDNRDDAEAALHRVWTAVEKAAEERAEP